MQNKITSHEEESHGEGPGSHCIVEIFGRKFHTTAKLFGGVVTRLWQSLGRDTKARGDFSRLTPNPSGNALSSDQKSLAVKIWRAECLRTLIPFDTGDRSHQENARTHPTLANTPLNLPAHEMHEQPQGQITNKPRSP